MSFDLDEIDRSVTSGLRDLLARRCSPSLRRATLSRSYDETLWKSVAHGLGLLPMALPVTAGGDEGGDVLVGLAVREMGRAIYDGPYMSSVVIASALVQAVDASVLRDELMTQVGAGSVRLTSTPSGQSGGVTASAAGDGWMVRGTVRPALDLEGASHVVIALPSSPGEQDLFVFDTTEPGVSANRLETFDLTRSLSRIELTDVPARRVGSMGRNGLQACVDRARIMLASEQLGGAAAALELALEHVRSRHQFGRAIGSYQAVKHQCADVLVAIETSGVAVDHALCLLEQGDDVAAVAPMVLAMSSDAYVHAATTGLHLHGGMGFTWEHDAHLHLRRAKGSAALMGTPSQLRARLLEQLDL